MEALVCYKLFYYGLKQNLEDKTCFHIDFNLVIILAVYDSV